MSSWESINEVSTMDSTWKTIHVQYIHKDLKQIVIFFITLAVIWFEYFLNSQRLFQQYTLDLFDFLLYCM